VDRGIITHPALTREVLRLLQELHVNLTVGDDIHGGVDGFLATGYRQICEELGVRLVNLKETGFVEVPVRGNLLKRVYIGRPVLEADAVINLPKLKTHSFTMFTGAVKNLYGIIPYGLRIEYHRRFRRSDVFSQMLVDLYSCLPPRLTIMDAVVGMDGEGPSSGAAKRIGLILGGADAVAVDALATGLVGLDPLQVWTTSRAHERGLGVGDLRLIDTAGEQVADVMVKDFRPSAVAVRFLNKRLPSFLYAYFQSQLVLIPEIVPGMCAACWECLKICPAQTISERGEKAWVDESRCIHCLCCHEVCSYRSIRLRSKPLGKAIRSMSTLYEKLAGALGKSHSII
jgi:uncharacterized protein (DUF362 family)/Pyruvate/2-oxoacid:ferredoxin oxidoreductase delta subunit